MGVRRRGIQNPTARLFLRVALKFSLDFMVFKLTHKSYFTAELHSGPDKVVTPQVMVISM